MSERKDTGCGTKGILLPSNSQTNNDIVCQNGISDSYCTQVLVHALYFGFEVFYIQYNDVRNPKPKQAKHMVWQTGAKHNSTVFTLQVMGAINCTLRLHKNKNAENKDHR
jgi:hypothetical protein